VHDVIPDEQPVPAGLLRGGGHGRDVGGVREVPEVGNVDRETHSRIVLRRPPLPAIRYDNWMTFDAIGFIRDDRAYAVGDFSP
jgi:hypothetical protein